jgi:hypothetical protein
MSRTKLDVVKVGVTSPVTREDVGSNPTWSTNWGPVAQWIERQCLWPFVPVQQ